jgi:DNA recombination protein RmuC
LKNRPPILLESCKNIFLGSAAKGSTGENIVEFMLSIFPPTWVVRNLVVANKVVEFGIKLPNDLILPIDSKLVVSDS